jgi:hypothetical protein
MELKLFLMKKQDIDHYTNLEMNVYEQIDSCENVYDFSKINL